MMVCSPSVLLPNIFNRVWEQSSSFNEGDVSEYDSHHHSCCNVTIIEKEDLYKGIENLKRRFSNRKKKAPNSSINSDESIPPIKKKRYTKQEREDGIFSRIFLPVAEDHEFIQHRKKRKEFEYADIPAFIPKTNRNPDEDFGELKEIAVWSPSESTLSEDEVIDYLKQTNERFNANEEQALALLWYHKHNICNAILDLENLEFIDPTKWSETDQMIFRLAFENCRLKDRRVTIYPIHKVLPHKRGPDIVQYYYFIKLKRKISLYQKLIRENTLHLPHDIAKFITKKEVGPEDLYKFLNTCKADKKKRWLRNGSIKTGRSIFPEN